MEANGGGFRTRWRLVVVVAACAAAFARLGLARVEAGTPDPATSAATQPAPKIRFAAPVFNFGEVAAGTILRHDYAVTNIGAAPLLITGVRPSCDCTTIGKWSARLEPGQNGIVPIQFDTTGYGGEVIKWVMVTSNDPEQSQMTLALEGKVELPIEVSPANAVFTPTNLSVGETRVIRITNQTGTPLVLSPPECSNKAFAVELRTVRPNQEFELRVKTVPPLQPGTVRGLVTIKTNSDHVPVIAITALAMVR